MSKLRSLDEKLFKLPKAYQKKLQKCCKKAVNFAGDRGIKIVVQGDKGHSDMWFHSANVESF